MEHDKLIKESLLSRFTTAQEQCYEQVIAELGEGKKTSHWIWYIFPQIFGLGFSEYSRYYGIKGFAEADAYWCHPLLKARYEECLNLILNSQKSAEDVLGHVDAKKLQSSITLFLEIDKTSELLSTAIDSLYLGIKDPHTLTILADSVAHKS
jgi:uncharacterized protein (DUF1810 family)